MADSATPERWLEIELRHIAALEAVASERSFRGAADRLGYVQSAVSQQILYLEELVGARLVDRSRGIAPVSLTADGELMLVHLKAIMSRFRTAVDDVSSVIAGEAGQVRVGVFHDVAVRLLPEVLSQFSSRCPDVEIVPVEAPCQATLVDMVERGELDVAFGRHPQAPGPFECIDLATDPYVLLVAADSELGDRDEAPSLAEIAQLPLVGDKGSRDQDHMVAALREHGHEPAFRLRADLNSTVQALVAQGLGVAIVPYLSVDPHIPGTTVHELPAVPARRLVMIRHRDHEPTRGAEAFVETVQGLCRRWYRHSGAGVAVA